MRCSEAINDLATALAKAQGQIQDAKKDSANPFFKSRYADLASVWEACRKPLSDNGLAVVQTIEVKEGKRILESTLIHASGQWISSSLDLLAKEETEQALGSAITYTRRYVLSALVGICPDDDDGEGAMARQAASKPTITTKPAQTPPATTTTPVTKPLPLTAAKVYKDLQSVLKQNLWTAEEATKRVEALGGKGNDGLERITSLSQENLAKLDAQITEAIKGLFG